MSADIFLSADCHLGHLRLAEEFRVGPFEPTVEAHAEWLLTTMHERVGPNDDLYILGDCFLGPKSKHQEYFDALPGKRKFLIIGNHDPKHVINMDWEWAREMSTLKVDGARIFMCHYPMLDWPWAHQGCFHAHGHTHGNMTDTGTTRLDVGVDAVGSYAPKWEWGPIPVEDLVAEFKSRTHVSVSHH